MDDIPVFFEHVHFLDGLDGLDVHLLEGGLQLLVVDAGGCGFRGGFLHLTAGSTFASVGGLVSVYGREGPSGGSAERVRTLRRGVSMILCSGLGEVAVAAPKARLRLCEERVCTYQCAPAPASA